MHTVVAILISIHSSLAGRDLRTYRNKTFLSNFNPLFPRGKRHFKILLFSMFHVFQSTLPSREETVLARCRMVYPSDFNPLFPRGKRLLIKKSLILLKTFQSTLPSREETFNIMLLHDRSRFQSTLPSREETCLS